MNKLSLMFGSRLFWTGFVLFVYTGLVGIVHLIPNIGWLDSVIGILGFVLINYFHVNPSQNYNQ